jgi:excisionase family DNA binding protein
MAEEWLTTDQAAEFSGLSRPHIRYLLRNGKMQGRKVGRDWVTTKTAIEEYLATNPKPGRQSRKFR